MFAAIGVSSPTASVSTTVSPERRWGSRIPSYRPLPFGT
jgi:hypothetical protein